MKSDKSILRSIFMRLINLIVSDVVITKFLFINVAISEASVRILKIYCQLLLKESKKETDYVAHYVASRDIIHYVRKKQIILIAKRNRLCRELCRALCRVARHNSICSKYIILIMKKNELCRAAQHNARHNVVELTLQQFNLSHELRQMTRLK